MREFEGGEVLIRRLIFRVGGQNEEIIYISELLDKAFKRSFKILVMFLIDFSYKGSVFSTKPTAIGFEVKLHSGSLNTKWDYYGFTYGSSNGSNLNMLFPVSKITTTYSENTNLNVIPKENKIVSLSLKFLGRII